jgi:hypothetical protein
MHAKLITAAAAAALLALPAHLFGYGKEGHAIVAHIASQGLNKKAKAAVAELLGPGVTLESVASWADEVRPQRKETSTWHYINIPIAVSKGEWQTYCPKTGCVIGVIPEMMARLQDPSLPKEQRAEALKFLVHFTADMSQPLHAGDRGDRGGNDVAFIWQGKRVNLHWVWDSLLLDEALQQQPQLKAKLERKAGWGERRRESKGTVAEWGWQSHDVSRDVVYAKLPPGPTPILGAEYLQQTLPALELQLRRGGIRLAKLLNQALGQ